VVTLGCVDLTKCFNGTVALDHVTLSLPPSGTLALIGPNGAGKTTLVNVLTGFLRPDAGRAFYGDAELTRLGPHAIVRAGVARTFQDLRLVKLITVVENVMLARQHQKGESFWRALTRFGVGVDERQHRGRALELLRLVGLERQEAETAGSLSFGQQKLLTLACCLATDARVVLLDEPVSGVHPATAEQILILLRRLGDDGKLIVFVEHDISAVKRTADRVIVMDEGQIVADGVPGDVLQRPEILEAYIE
jgi:ABC-type branched-subunit amino acid transport system ATPase component